MNKVICIACGVDSLTSPCIDCSAKLDSGFIAVVGVDNGNVARDDAIEGVRWISKADFIADFGALPDSGISFSYGRAHGAMN